MRSRRLLVDPFPSHHFLTKRWDGSLIAATDTLPRTMAAYRSIGRSRIGLTQIGTVQDMAMAKGSSMSSKQLARTAVDGRMITLIFTGVPQTIDGYLCGMDDFHLFVITPTGKKYLVHKGSIAVVSFAEQANYRVEPNHRELEKVVGPFRAAVQRDHLAPTTNGHQERLVAS